MLRKTILLLLFIGCFSGMYGQVADTTQGVDFYYSAPRTYELAGIEIVGIKELYDADMLKSQSGLRVGQRIVVPGPAITKAVNRLYDLQIFSDISIEADRVEGENIYLKIVIQEPFRLSEINYIGLKKSEESKIKERINLQLGAQVTGNVKTNLKMAIERYLKEKGFYNMNVRIVQRDDPNAKNHVLLDAIVEKKNKIKIQDVIITGNEEMGAGKLKAAMKKTKEKSIVNFFKSSNYIEKNFEEDRYNLLTKYNEKGYRDAVILSDSVVPVSSKRLKIYIDVSEGNKYYFNTVTWVGNTQYSSMVLSEILGIRKGDVYNSTLLNERLLSDDDAVSNVYQNNGYLFSRMQAVESVVGNDSINLQIRVLEGPLATLNRVMIKGNTTTHEHVIRRELYTYPGDVWSKENVMRSLRQLGQMGFFDPEKLKPEPTPNPEEGTVDLIYGLEEKSNDNFELSGGWGAGMIMFSIKLGFNNFSIRNIFNKDAYHPLPQGDGQKFSLQAQSNGKFYTTFSISFEEPWMGGKKPNSFSTSLHFSRQTGFSSAYNNSYLANANNRNEEMDQLMLTYGASIGLGRRINWPDYMFQMYNSVSYQRYQLKNWQYYIINNGNSNTLSFSTVISRRSVFNPIFPKSGSDFTFSLQATPPYSVFVKNGRMEAESERVKFQWIEYHKWKFNGKVYIPLTEKNVEFSDEVKRPLVLYTGIQFGYLGHYNKHRQSPFEGFEMGGDGMSGYSVYGREYIGLRGYENGSLTNAGSSFIVPQASDAKLFTKFVMELRYPIILGQTANTIYALTFLEAGNSWYRLKDFEPFNLYRSAGVGLRVYLPMFGMLGIDWGYGFDKISSRASASGGQFHFVMGQEF